MGAAELWAFVAAGFALVGSPGPATLSLAAAGAAFDREAARVYLFGIVTGAALVILAVAAGTVTAILSVPYAGAALAAVSFAYLGYLAYRIATAPPVGTGRAAAPGFMTGLVFNLSNPKAYAAFAALFAGFDLVPDAPLRATVLETAIGVRARRREARPASLSHSPPWTAVVEVAPAGKRTGGACAPRRPAPMTCEWRRAAARRDGGGTRGCGNAKRRAAARLSILCISPPEGGSAC